MINKKYSYQKLVFVLMFVTFTGVVVSDLVHMHLRLIYDINLLSENQFIKPVKEKSKDELKVIDCKSDSEDDQFAGIRHNDSKHIHFVLLLNKKDKVISQTDPFYDNNHLRAPPANC